MSKVSFDKWKEDLLEKATELQQSFYAQFKDFNIYVNNDEHVHLKNHIGVTLFGPPRSEKHKNEFLFAKSEIRDILNFQLSLYSVFPNFTMATSAKKESGLYNYRSDQLKVINSIYEKVVEHGTEPETNFVYCANIYKIVCKNTKADFENISNENGNAVQSVPLFRVQKYMKIGKSEAEKGTRKVTIEGSVYDTQDWFIDEQGKVYESWFDYLESDKSPNYAIIYPKDGVYQTDLRKKISKDFDPVWIEVRPSLEEWRNDLLERATTVQQSFYEMLSDFNTYSSKDLLYLKMNIAYALFGLPELQKSEDNTAAGTYLDGITNVVTNLRGYLFGTETTPISSTFDEKQLGALKLYNSYNDNQKQTVDSIFKIIVPSENPQLGENSDIYYCGNIYNVVYDDSEENYHRIFEKSKKKDEQNSQSSCNSEEENSNRVESEEVRYEILFVDFHGTVHKSLDDPEELKNANVIFPVPLFKIKKNIKIEGSSKDEKETQKSSSEEDRYSFVDAEGRVYDTWEDYVTTNTLPKCTMVFPKNGVYQANPEKHNSEDFTSVWIESQLSPASNRTITQVIDTVTGIIGGVGLGICAVGLVTPVAPVVSVAAGISTGVTALWGAGRSAQKLKDRSDHRQSIWLDNKDSIVAWLGIAGCTVGAAASGSSVILSRAAQRGVSIGRLAKSTYDAIVVGNLAINGAGIVYRAHELLESYRTGKQIDTVEIVFLSAHILFFYNTMVNVKFAQTVVDTEQQKVLKAFEDSLRSNRHRKQYARLVRNTSKLSNSLESTNEEIIRSFQNIENKDEFFATMVRNRKTVAKAAFADGKVQIDGNCAIDPNEFAKLSKTEISNIVGNNQPGASSSSSQNTLVSNETTAKLPNSKLSNVGVNKAKKLVAKSKEGKLEAGDAKIADSRGDESHLHPNKSEIVKLNERDNGNSRASAAKGPDSSGKKSNVKSNESKGESNLNNNKSSKTSKAKEGSGKKTDLRVTEKKMELKAMENNNKSLSSFVLCTTKVLSQIDLDVYLRILRNFCSQENTEVPNVNEFMDVLTDIQSYHNPGEIFQKLLEVALKFVKKMKLSNELPSALKFLWAKVKIQIRNSYWKARDDAFKNLGSEEIQKFLIIYLDDIYVKIEGKGDEYVNEFIAYLQEILENWEKDENEKEVPFNENTAFVNPRLPHETEIFPENS